MDPTVPADDTANFDTDDWTNLVEIETELTNIFVYTADKKLCVGINDHSMGFTEFQFDF